MLLILFMIAFAVLDYPGIQPPSPVGLIILQTGIILYFVFSLAMSTWSRIGTFEPVPRRVAFTPR